LFDIKNIKNAREEEGEMVELKGYSIDQLKKLDLKAKNVFNHHKHELVRYKNKSSLLFKFMF
jgi:hypothetical protein